MKLSHIGALATLLAAGPALAADLAPRAAPPEWQPKPAQVYAAPIFTHTGFYVGMNGGYGWNGGRFANIPAGSWAGSANAMTVALAGSGATPSGGWAAGGQLGYNRQFGAFVLGAETDLDYLGARRRTVFATPTAGGFVIAQTETGAGDLLGTARLRAGAAFGKALVYATGGLAYGRVGATQTLIFPTSIAYGSQAGLKLGWALGAGAEYAILPNWTLRAEYLHADLGQSRATLWNAAFPTFPHLFRTTTHVDLARAGLNYRFGAPAPYGRW
ncbi:MAG: porin family protein [Hyphomicrobiales bacterium]|nr:porin family protein [Hyphomicrobiales bacterium]